MALCERALEQGVFAQAIRPPTVPHGTSRLRMTAMATHKVGELRRAAKVIGEAARELGTSPRRRPRPHKPKHLPPRRSPSATHSPARPSPRVRGTFVTGTGTEVGKTVVAAVLARAQAAQRPGRVAVFKPAVSGLDELAGELPDHELLRLASDTSQSDDEIAPYRYGPAGLPPPRGRDGGRGDRPGAAPSRGPCCGRRARPPGLRGGRRIPGPTDPRLPGAGPGSRVGAAGSDRRLTGPRHDQPHAADVGGGAGRGPRGRRRSW